MRYCFLLFCVASLNVDVLLAAEEDPVINHENVRWKQLVYEASAFFITLETDIKLSTVNKESELNQFVLGHREDLQLPEHDEFFRLDTYSQGFGKDTRYQLWFDSNGSALQRKKTVKGKKNEIKVYRFTSCGHYKLRKKFPNDSFDVNFNRWLDSEAQLTNYPSELCNDHAIYDVNTLLYIISTLNIRHVGFEKELLVVSKGKVYTVKLTAKKKTSIYSEYDLKSPNGNSTFEDDVDVLEVHITPVTNSKSERDRFKFLGLKGKVRVYIDTENQLILRIKGKIKVLGSIDINLKKAVLTR